MKNKFLFPFCLLLSSLLLWSCVEDLVSYTGNIIGKVTDARTGMPLGGATVTITPGGLSRTTGSNGIFEFRDLEAKQYEIQVQKDGYVTNNKTINVTMGTDAVGDIMMTPVKQDGQLALSVSTLNFGSQSTSLSFSIQNTGNKSFNWNISGTEKLNWLSISPISGTLNAGKSNAVTVTLNRNYITQYVEGIIIVNADNESLPLKITADPDIKSSKISLSTTSLNFGTEYTSLSFDVKNVGNAGDVDWEVAGIDVNWIKVSPLTGTTAMDKSSVVKVELDRDKLSTGTHNTTIMVKADGESLYLRIMAEVKSKDSKILLSDSTLNFGTEQSTLSFEVKNVGNAGDVNWEVTGVDVDWIKVTPTSGTTAMGKSSVVKVDLYRSRLTEGEHNTSIIVNGSGESLCVNIKAQKAPDRYLEVYPSVIKMGINEEESFTVISHNGATSFELYGRGDFQWASFSEVKGVIPEYAPNDIETVKFITIYADRTGLTPGEYTFTLIIRSDLGDYEVPVSMTVEESATSDEVCGEIISCHDDLEFTLTSCKMSGTTATIEFTIENIGSKSFDLALWGKTGGYSYVFDDQGNEYSFGYNEVKLTLGKESSTSGVSATIPSGVKVKGSVIVYDVADEAASFNIILWTNKNAGVNFKNIAIQGRSSTTPNTPQTTGTVITCHDDLEFTLLDCKRGVGDNVTLTYNVKNVTKKNHELILWGKTGGRSYVFDDQGNEYSFGYNKVKLTLGKESSTSGVSAIIPAESVIKGSIIIYEVDPSAAEMSNITLYSGSSSANLIFKNVKIR